MNWVFCASCSILVQKCLHWSTACYWQLLVRFWVRRKADTFVGFGNTDLHPVRLMSKCFLIAIRNFVSTCFRFSPPVCLLVTFAFCGSSNTLVGSPRTGYGLYVKRTNWKWQTVLVTWNNLRVCHVTIVYVSGFRSLGCGSQRTSQIVPHRDVVVLVQACCHTTFPGCLPVTWFAQYCVERGSWQGRGYVRLDCLD